MRRVDRTIVSAPEPLSRIARRGQYRGLSEGEAILRAFDAHVSSNADPTKFPFEYRAYRDPAVKQALHTLFLGKCAYCESRYAGVQPMDVEHWRPKAFVHEFDKNGKPQKIAGYPWLAADWQNLLPSCIDCNRVRTQRDAETGVVETVGKGNQFPVAGPRMKVPKPGGPLTAADDALLLNPTVDHPGEHLLFHQDGLVTPKGNSAKGAPSIRVYALNRSELVVDRLGIARLIEQRLITLEVLAEAISHPDLPGDVRLNLQDLASHEIDSLYAFADPDRPFSAMARELIDQNNPVPHLAPSTSPTASWSPEVWALLARFSASNPNADHDYVAKELGTAGFVSLPPQARGSQAPSKAPYIRWQYRGKRDKAMLYQDSRGLISDRQKQLSLVAALRGAVRTSVVRPRIAFSYAESSEDDAIAAAQALKSWADRG